MILIYGAGGMGREVAQCVRDLAELAPADFELGAFIDDAEPHNGRRVHGLPVLHLPDALAVYPKAEVVLAVGDSAARERLARRCAADGLRSTSIVHPSSDVGDCVRVGLGTYIGPRSVLTCDIALGVQVQVNAGCLIHHDCVVGDYVTLSPCVTLCGDVRIGRGAFLGAGAVVKQGVRIGERAVIGMGAVVIRDVPDGGAVGGNPARPIRHGRFGLWLPWRAG